MNDDLTSGNGHTHAVADGLRMAISRDDAREGLPFEHTGTLLASLGFAVCGLRSHGRSWTLLHGMIAGALLWRSLSGRDGVRRWVDAPRARPAEPSASADASAQTPQPGGPF